MIKFLSSTICLFLILAAPVTLHGSNIFPYDYKIEVLENGLKIISIPLPNPYIISYYTIVRSGSRNEVEPGKSGFAHFFEHMMFKGTETMSPEEYDNFLSEIGAGTNAFTSDEKIDKPALDLLAEYAFSRSSAIYQKLVIEEQICQSLNASFSDHRDPYLLVFNAIVKDEKDLPYVEEEILGELERLKKETISEERLADIKSNLKYSFANSLGTADDIASVLAFYINLAADPGTVNKFFELYERVTPLDIMEMAQKYFIPTNSTVVTLTGGGA